MMTFKQFLTETPIKKHTKQIEKGLSREEALKKAPWKSSYGDCRGFSYNPKTGEATWI